MLQVDDETGPARQEGHTLSVNMAFANVAFITPAPGIHSQILSTFQKGDVNSLRKPASPPFHQPLRRWTNPTAGFQEDFFTGPSSPPRPRPLYQVIIFSVTTGLLWYGYYKFCIEEELLNESGKGLGGIGTLAPLMAGITAPLYAPTGGPAEFLVGAGIAWIVAIQFTLYRRINSLMLERDEYEPLVPWWVVVPGFNLVAGLRSVHFLSVLWGFPPDDDPLVNVFPCLGVRTLGMLELATTPSLWFKLGK